MGGLRILAVFPVLYATLAAAEPGDPPAKGGVVSTDARNARLDAAYRAEMVRSDRGLERAGGEGPDARTTLRLEDFYLMFYGQVREAVDFSIVLELAYPEEPVDQALVTWHETPALSFGFGKTYVNEGGYEERNITQETLVYSPYVGSFMPLARTSAVLEAIYGLAGAVTVQVIEDKPPPKPDAPAVTPPEEPRQPAVTLEWAGDLGAFKPLLQAGSYGHGNAKYAVVGAGVVTDAFHFYADYVHDVRKGRKDADGTLYRNVSLETGWDGVAAVKPYLRLAWFDVTQPESRDYNAETEAAPGTIDDNAVMAHVGLRFPLEDGAFVPFVAATRTTGVFQDPDDAEATETRAQLDVHLGVSGAM